MICLAVTVCTATAQEEPREILRTEAPDNMPYRPKGGLASNDASPVESRVMGITAPDLSANDTLHLPQLNRYGQARIGMYPMEWCGTYNWDLHRGLNINIGASVFAILGKHSPYKGAGFGQNISAMYAVPLTGKLSFAAGGYLNNMYWAHSSYRDAGVNAVLGYKFDEHWEAYLYGQKSLTNKRMPMPLYDMSSLGDRVGAAVRYNFNPNFSIQVSVSTGDMPDTYVMPVYSEPARKGGTAPYRRR